MHCIILLGPASTNVYVSATLLASDIKVITVSNSIIIMMTTVMITINLH